MFQSAFMIFVEMDRHQGEKFIDDYWYNHESVVFHIDGGLHIDPLVALLSRIDLYSALGWPAAVEIPWQLGQAKLSKNDS